jgi:hypothetical protein
LNASGDVDIGVYDFFHVSGSLAIQKSSQTISVWNGAVNVDVSVDMLIIGGNDVHAFAGVNFGTAAQAGFDLTDADFGLALLSDGGREWLSLMATASGVTIVGMAGLTFRAGALEVVINEQAGDGSLINYAETNLCRELCDSERRAWLYQEWFHACCGG